MRRPLLALLALILAAVTGWAAWTVWAPGRPQGYACAGLDRVMVAADSPTLTTTGGVVCVPA